MLDDAFALIEKPKRGIIELEKQKLIFRGQIWKKIFRKMI